PVPPARIIASLLRELPADARPRARVLVPYGTVSHVYQVASALSSHLPNPGEVEVIGEHEVRTAAPEPAPIRVVAPAPAPVPTPFPAPVEPVPMVQAPVELEPAPAQASDVAPRREVRSHRGGGDKSGRDR